MNFKVDDRYLTFWCKDCGENFSDYNPSNGRCYICRSLDFHKQSQLSYWMSRIIPGHKQVNNTINRMWYGGVRQLKDRLVEGFLKS